MSKSKPVATASNYYQISEQEWRQDRAIREVWIPIEMLRIPRYSDTPDGYQRDKVKKTIRTITEGWDYNLWDRPWVTASPACPGLFDVLDGGNRIDSLKVMGYTGAVPCSTRDAATNAAAAKAFRKHNGNRESVPAFNLYVSDLVAEEPWALDVKSVLDRHGLTLTHGKTGHDGNLACSYGLKKVYDVDGKVGVERLVRVASEMMEGDTNIFRQEYLWGLHQALKELTEFGLSEERLIATVKGRPFEALQLDVFKNKGNHAGKGASTVVKETFKALYNKGLRTQTKWQ